MTHVSKGHFDAVDYKFMKSAFKILTKIKVTTICFVFLLTASVKSNENQIMPDWSYSSLAGMIKKDKRVTSKKIISINIEGVKKLDVYLSDYPSLSGFGELVVITYDDTNQKWSIASVKTVEQ